MKSRFRLAALGAAVSVFLVACGGTPSPTMAAPANSKAPADQAARDPHEALTSKLNACISRVSTRSMRTSIVVPSPISAG